ncbi:MFS transporter [Galbitalea soli]|uniref:MFS transporter n=1 Tax=Galbitalea soli TaxID=1268042 RepID=A0A7C9TP72_9MICO|nr:MFS transporter [Galbitalea soli]NEM90536.1 MFS transporter [Galbitalea soli]NYJ31249.1 MFS family permease [Galbitalea soli]
MSDHEPPFRWRSIALPAFLPTLLFSTGEGAIIPIIPTVAHGLGATLAFSGFVAALIMVGEVFGDIPSGWLVNRVGERAAMIGGALVAMGGLGVAAIAPNEGVLAVGILLVGLATAVFALARHAFMTSFVPQQYRARALSTLGGTFRLGYFVGPFLAAGVIGLTGSTAAVFWVDVVACLGAAIILLSTADPAATLDARRAEHATAASPHRPFAETRGVSEGRDFVEAEAHGLFRTIWASRAVLARLGTGAALVGGVRSSRQVILPLWAVSIGIADSNTALIIGIAGAIDFALFYASGQIMDRWGRLASVLPSMIGLGLGHLALAFSHDLPGDVVWFITVAMFLSLANGIGSGILMTLGADLADKRNPAPFLGAWRFTADLGSAAAPLAVSFLTGIASIAVASGVIGVLGLLGAGIMWRYIPRYLPRALSGVSADRAR